ncbi:MAG TPA: autotransporter-associated beta strand repeat-containing protein, partial [Luteolibacter sp.]
SGTVALNGTAGASTVNVTAGTLTLGSANRLADSAAVTVSGGNLIMGGADTVGTFAMSSGSIGGSSTLTATTYGLSGGTVTGNLGTGTLNSSGTVALNGTAGASAVNVTAGTLTLGNANRLADSAAVTVSGGSLNIGGFNDSVGAVTLSGGSISGSGGILTGTSYAVQSGSISASLGGSGVALTKSTAGTVTLSGANTYTGTTTVEAGTLTLTGTGAISSTLVLGTSGGGIATLDALAKSSTIDLASVTGNGTLKGDFNVTSALGPGFSPGSLTFEGDLTLGNTTVTTMEMGVISDEINVIGTLTLDGILNVTGTGFLGTEINLFTANSISGEFDSVNIGGAAFTFNSGNGMWTGSFGGDDYSFSPTSGNLAAVPEPSAALLGGLGMLFLLRRRRDA